MSFWGRFTGLSLRSDISKLSDRGDITRERALSSGGLKKRDAVVCAVRAMELETAGQLALTCGLFRGLNAAEVMDLIGELEPVPRVSVAQSGLPGIVEGRGLISPPTFWVRRLGWRRKNFAS
jgi:hypothetical protein